MKAQIFSLCIFAAILSAQSAHDNFRFTLTGDSIIDRRISVYDEPGYLQMFDRIRSADAAFTNFEMLVHNFEYPGAPVSGGSIVCRSRSLSKVDGTLSPITARPGRVGQ